MMKQCDVCGKEFETNIQNKKRCSPECSNKAWNSYVKNRAYNLYHNNSEFKKTSNESSRKWQKNNREKCNKYHNKYSKDHNLNKMIITDIESKFLQNLADKQQVFTYVRKTKCEVPNCQNNSSNSELCFHEISYSPVESITLCAHHHALLHHRFLNGKKVKIRKNEIME